MQNDFGSGNFTAVALNGDRGEWQTYAALGLIGKSREAIEGLSHFDLPEAKFYSAVASWIDGDEPRAISQLKDLSLPHARNLLALIRKKKIHVLAQLDRGSQWDFISALPKDGKFKIQNFGFKPGDKPNQPYADVHQFYDRNNPPDFYVTKLVEWHQLPPNLRELPCPIIGHTADYDIHIQTVHPWLQLLDEVVVTDHTEWADVSKLVKAPVSAFPKAFGLGKSLPLPAAGDRPTDVFISGTAMHPYHPDKAQLLHQILDMPELAVKFVNGFVGAEQYQSLLSETKVGFTYVRHPGAMPTRGLESLAMGAAIAVQEGSVLQLFLGENEGVVTYDLHKGNLPVAIRNILANWTEFEQRARRGAAIVRQEFEMSRVAQQYFRFLTFLAAKPRATRNPKPVPHLEQKRSILLKGWVQSPKVNRQFREASLLRWADSLETAPTPQRVIDMTRELLLEYATAAYQPVARDYSANFRVPLTIRRELLEQALRLSRLGVERFPRSLVLRFNWIRAALHFGNRDEVSEAIIVLDETLGRPVAEWQVDATEDVFPWDYFSQFFNYRAYFDLCTASLQDGQSREDELARLILGSLRYYRSFHSATAESSVESVGLDDQFPFYKLQCARQLIRDGDSGSIARAGELLGHLVRSSMLFLQAFEELHLLHEQGRYTHPDFNALSTKVQLARRRIFTANYGVEDWDAIPLRPAARDTLSTDQNQGATPRPVDLIDSNAAEPATDESPALKVLFLPLEISDWKQARHISYPVQWGIIDALEKRGAEVVTFPMMLGLSDEAHQTWLRELQDRTSGQKFDQVWIELVHSKWDEDSLKWLEGVAPKRIGFLMESMAYDEQSFAIMPKLRKRRTLVESRLRHLTHLVAVDEADVQRLNEAGTIPTLWWPQSVPERFIVPVPPAVPDSRALFYGQLYGQRKAWLEFGDLKRLMIRPDQSPEDAAGWPGLFDAANQAFATTLERGSKLTGGDFQTHVRLVRRIREESFRLWISGLQEGSAVVNLPSLFSGYAGRVYEAMAAGRPVVSWDVTDRPRTRRLFVDGEEILLYRKDHPNELSAHLHRLRRDGARANEIATKARSGMLALHTTERRVEQILNWIKTGATPDFSKPAGTKVADITKARAERPTPASSVELDIVLGRLHLGLRETEEAHAALTRATTLQPRNPEAQVQLARTAAAKQDFQSFHKALNAALGHEPDYPAAWRMLAEESRRHGLKAQAVEINRLLLTRTANSSDASVGLAEVYLDPKPACAPDEAVVLKICTEQIEAGRALARRRTQRQEKIELPAAARLGSLHGARELLQRKDLTGAWSAAVAAIGCRPFHPEAHLLLAEIALAAGQLSTARSLGEYARSLAPQWKPARQFVQAIPRNATIQVELPPFTPSDQSRLSVCLIAKNEERFLARCLESIRGLAHQIVVLDTGSSDRTPDIARAFGAEVHFTHWVDDFSAARNAALQHATGDWILFLDADEELVASDRDKLCQLLKDRNAIAFRLPILDKGREEEGVNYVPRLYRNAPGLFYIGRVHEQVFSSLEVRRAEWGLENRLGEATLLHHGYVKELILSRDKVNRNLRLLELAVQELPDEPNLLMNLGLELVRDDRLQEGLQQYQEAFDVMSAQPKDRVSPELREALLTQYSSHLLNTGNYAEVARVLQSPLARAHGLTATMHWLLGLACIESKLYSEGADQMRECISQRGKRALTLANKNILKGGPHHCLALCLAAMKRHEEAARAFESAMKAEPENRTISFDFARSLADSGEEVEALKCIHQLMAEDPTEVRVWRLGGTVSLNRPEFIEFALDWTSEAVRHHPTNPGLLEQRATALLLSDDPSTALTLIRQLRAVPSASAIALRIACEVLAGNEPSSPPPALQEQTDQEFLRLYRRLIDFGANAAVSTLNERLDALRQVVPQTTHLLEAAITEASHS